MVHRIGLITGAGSGIGRTVAVALSQHGYALVLAGRQMESLRETAAFLADDALEPMCITADVSNEAEVDALFNRIEDTHQRLDLLFNNAGIAAPDIAIENLSLAAWETVIQTNLTGAFLCLQGAFRVMKSQTPMGGRIINSGSVSAHSPRPHSAPYTASKHAITGLTKSASLDGRAYNIACCQLDIGNAETAMGAQTEKGAQQADGTTKTEPVMDVTHVGEAVCFMDSLPLEANVQFMTLMATAMPFVGRG